MRDIMEDMPGCFAGQGVWMVTQKVTRLTHSCWLAFHVQVRRAIGGSLIDENDAIYQEVRACTVSSHISS